MEYLSKAKMLAMNSLEKVELPRRVIIRNMRLGLTLRTMQAGVVCGVVWIVFRSNDWIKVELPVNAGVLAMWDDAGNAGYEASVAASNTLCSKPELYDYVYSTNWRYEDYTCSVPAGASERINKESDSVMYVPMSYEETRYIHVDGGGGNCTSITQSCASPAGWKPRGSGSLCECQESSFHFVPGVEALKVSFDHGYSLSVSQDDKKSAQRSDQSCVDGFDSTCEKPLQDGMTNELRTIMVVKVGEEEKLIGWYDAPQTLQLPLQEILTVAGLSLDTPVPLGPNLLFCGTPGAEANCSNNVHPNPVIRQTGLEVGISLAYSNYHLHPDVPCEDCLKNHIGPLCKAVISLKPKWLSRQTVDCDTPKNSKTGEAVCTSRYQYGIKVVFTGRGEFGIIDPFFILLAVGASLAYLAVPLIIMNAFAMYFLGALSSVYFKAEKEEVKMDKQLSGMVSRLITSQVAYTTLTGGDSNPLTKDMLLERMHTCLKESGQDALDIQEQIRLAEIVMNALDPKGSGEITMNQFVEAALSNDPIGMKDAMNLFDADRKPGILEKLCTPSAWSHKNRRVKAIFERTEGTNQYNEAQIMGRVSEAKKQIDESLSVRRSAVPQGLGNADAEKVNV